MDVESKGALSRAEGVEKVVAVEIEPLVFPLRKGVFTAKNRVFFTRGDR